jgi:soluble cytochrome b562
MRSKKSISMILAAAVLATGISFVPARASAVTEGSVKIESKEQNKNVRSAVQKAIKDLNEENIKEARKMIAEVEDTNLKYLYNKALEYNIYKNVDKKVSPVDELVMAFDKTNKVTSCESNIKVDLNMDGKNLTQEEMQSFAPIMQIVNGIKIDGISKFVGNGKNTEISAKAIKSFFYESNL